MKQKQTRVGDRGNGLLPAGTAPIHNTADAGSQAEDDERGLDRIIFFSDAVFAIAITLLALDIRLPPLPETAGNADLLAALGHTWPQFLSYSISFLAIGMIWLAHHRTFRSVQRYDERLMLLNLFFLLLIGFVPFPTTVIGEYGNTVSTVFYAATMATAGLMFALVWWHANAHGRLVAPPLPTRQFRRVRLRVLWMPAVFLLSIPLAFWSPDGAKYVWLLILVTVVWRPTARPGEARLHNAPGGLSHAKS